MKKIIAILFLAVYLCSLAGDSLFIEYLIQKNDVEAVRRIDNGEYIKGQLVEIKVPLRLPYYSSSLKYERYYGEIEIGGRYYDYVMRKVINDTVYLLCLPNQTKTELQNAKITAGLSAADMKGPSTNSKGTTSDGKKQVSVTEYCQHISCFNFLSSAPELSSLSNMFSLRLITCFIEPPVKPPIADAGASLQPEAASCSHTGKEFS